MTTSDARKAQTGERSLSERATSVWRYRSTRACERGRASQRRTTGRDSAREDEIKTHLALVALVRRVVLEQVLVGQAREALCLGPARPAAHSGIEREHVGVLLLDAPSLSVACCCWVGRRRRAGRGRWQLDVDDERDDLLAALAQADVARCDAHPSLRQLRRRQARRRGRRRRAERRCPRRMRRRCGRLLLLRRELSAAKVERRRAPARGCAGARGCARVRVVRSQRGVREAAARGRRAALAHAVGRILEKGRCRARRGRRSRVGEGRVGERARRVGREGAVAAGRGEVGRAARGVVQLLLEVLAG